MANESRLKKSLLNARVNVIFYFIMLMVSFFSRKVFLDTLGDEFMGFTSTIGNLLGFLNIAEMGIVSAIAFVLYKPLFEGDREAISEIISVLGYLYRIVGFIIMGGGLVLACLLPVIYPDTGFSWGVIYFVFFSYLCSSLLTYFANYKQTLLAADQRYYVVAIYYQSSLVVKSLVQMAIAYYTGNYYLWIAMELVAGVAYVWCLNWKLSRVYPWLHSDKRRGRQLLHKYPQIMQKARQLLVHKIGGFVQNQTTPFIIYTFVSLKMVAFYGNYSIILIRLVVLVNNLLGSTHAGVGNLIAEGNRERIVHVFWELFGLQFFIAGTLSFAMFQLTGPFITLWLGAEYLLPTVVLALIIANLFITLTRSAVDQFMYGYGLFADVWAPVAESCICLVVAIVGGSLWGLPGVLLGNVSSLFLIIAVWKPIYLYHSGFKMPYVGFVAGYVKHFVLVALPAVSLYYLLPARWFEPGQSIWNWLLFATATVSAYAVVALGLMLMFCPAMRSLLRRFPIGKLLRR